MSAGPRATCRFCHETLRHTFVDLSSSPLCQTHIEPDRLNLMEPFYPLHAWVCHNCFLVQLEEYVAPSNIFTDYAYFSSYSDSWVAHAKRYTDLVTRRFGLGPGSKVMEIASNDGYLLQHFVRSNIPVLGIEPAANVAQVAIDKGIPTTVQFFGTASAQRIVEQFGQPDLLLGNNVLAHVPDINDFVQGMKRLLKPGGVVTMEFPHLLQLMDRNQFDTIYHEHFSYLSLLSVARIFEHHGLKLFDVEEIATHGGSLRIYARHVQDEDKPVTAALQGLKQREIDRGLNRIEGYEGFGERVKETKRKLLAFLIEVKNAGKTVIGYGAPGKGNTLLNYCGIRTDFLDYTVDRSPHKQGRYTPGTRIPILDPQRIRETRPDYILFLPWNLKEELAEQLEYTRAWGCKFVLPIPSVVIF